MDHQGPGGVAEKPMTHVSPEDSPALLHTLANLLPLPIASVLSNSTSTAGSGRSSTGGMTAASDSRSSKNVTAYQRALARAAKMVATEQQLKPLLTVMSVFDELADCPSGPIPMPVVTRLQHAFSTCLPEPGHRLDQTAVSTFVDGYISAGVTFDLKFGEQQQEASQPLHITSVIQEGAIKALQRAVTTLRLSREVEQYCSKVTEAVLQALKTAILGCTFAGIGIPENLQETAAQCFMTSTAVAAFRACTLGHTRFIGRELLSKVPHGVRSICPDDAFLVYMMVYGFLIEHPGIPYVCFGNASHGVKDASVQWACAASATYVSSSHASPASSSIAQDGTAMPIGKAAVLTVGAAGDKATAQLAKWKATAAGAAQNAAAAAAETRSDDWGKGTGTLAGLKGLFQRAPKPKRKTGVTDESPAVAESRAATTAKPVGAASSSSSSVRPPDAAHASSSSSSQPAVEVHQKGSSSSSSGQTGEAVPTAGSSSSSSGGATGSARQTLEELVGVKFCSIVVADLPDDAEATPEELAVLSSCQYHISGHPGLHGKAPQFKWSAVHFAVACHKVNLVRQLLQLHGCPVSPEREHGLGPMHLACLGKISTPAKLVEFVLEHCRDIYALQTYAMSAGPPSLPIIQLLLQKAEQYVMSRDMAVARGPLKGLTPLHLLACWQLSIATNSSTDEGSSSSSKGGSSSSSSDEDRLYIATRDHMQALYGLLVPSIDQGFEVTASEHTPALMDAVIATLFVT